MAGRAGDIPGAAHLVVVHGVTLLYEDQQVFEAMLRAFQATTNAYPWQWPPQHLEEWPSDLRDQRNRVRSTIRGYDHVIRTFCTYLTDGRYGWVDECERRFGSHPIQICFAWNTASHTSDYEGNPARRALTKPELQRLFDLADDEVARARHAGRKGWLAAFRDVTLFKVTYAWGLRLLAERGINLSAAQVYRLVAHPPERLSLRTLAALCNIFACTPNDLLEPYAAPTAVRKVVGEAPGKAPRKLRPKRARIVDDEP